MSSRVISNNVSNNVSNLIKTKVIKASNTNGLKQEILLIIAVEQHKRRFNRYEVLNAINAIPRTQFYVKVEVGGEKLKIAKYEVVRKILKHEATRTYLLDYSKGKLLLTLY